MKYNNVTGIILAGGKSTRMGENKSLLKLNGITIIERIINLMNSLFKNVVLITNTAEEYYFIDTPKYKDIFECKGPLAGIHSGLTNSTTDKNFIISCDMPLMEKRMIEYIIDYKTEKPITICKADGFIQHLAGQYSKSVLPIITDLFSNERDKTAVLSLLDIVPAEIINAEELDIYKKHMFFNMNRPEDYKRIIELS